MGWYRAVAHPVFFALAPETAHRLAIRLLGLPMPWERISGAVADPALAVQLAGVRLANPIGLAAGFDKACTRLDALGRLGFGYVVGGTITRASRAGNARPRIARSTGRQALVNAMGLPNPGADTAVRALARTPRTSPRFVSIGDESLEDVVATHALLAPHVDGIELNASCPNVSWGRDRDNEAHLSTLLRGLADRRSPLFVKLPPFRTDVEREVVLTLARIAVEGGADGLVCSNTRPVADGRLAVGRGGLSGRVLLPDTIRIVADVRAVTEAVVPIVACGGIFTAEDAVACLDAGATAVQVYTGLVYGGPGILREMTTGMAASLHGSALSTPPDR